MRKKHRIKNFIEKKNHIIVLPQFVRVSKRELSWNRNRIETIIFKKAVDKMFKKLHTSKYGRIIL